MAPDKSDPTPAETEQLQYECHPFPAYVDYIYGRPTEYERMMGVNGTGYGGIQDGNLQVHAGNAPAPVANASAPAHWPSQLERSASAGFDSVSASAHWPSPVASNLDLFNAQPTLREVVVSAYQNLGLDPPRFVPANSMAPPPRLSPVDSMAVSQFSQKTPQSTASPPAFKRAESVGTASNPGPITSMTRLSHSMTDPLTLTRVDSAPPRLDRMVPSPSPFEVASSNIDLLLQQLPQSTENLDSAGSPHGSTLSNAATLPASAGSMPIRHPCPKVLGGAPCPGDHPPGNHPPSPMQSVASLQSAPPQPPQPGSSPSAPLQPAHASYPNSFPPPPRQFVPPLPAQPSFHLRALMQPAQAPYPGSHPPPPHQLSAHAPYPGFPSHPPALHQKTPHAPLGGFAPDPPPHLQSGYNPGFDFLSPSQFAAPIQFAPRQQSLPPLQQVPPSQLAPNAAVAPPPPQPTVSCLGRDELLTPTYSNLPDKFRQSTNNRVNAFYDVIVGPFSSVQDRQAAQASLEAISRNVHTAMKIPPSEWANQNQMEMYFRAIHEHMPKVYDALKLAQAIPEHPMAPKAKQYLGNISRTLKGPACEYMKRLLGEMAKTAAEGKVAYQAIPGWREKWDREHRPGEVKQATAKQEHDVQQSMGETSPLPEWKGF